MVDDLFSFLVTWPPQVHTNRISSTGMADVLELSSPTTLDDDRSAMLRNARVTLVSLSV